jgi:hypothetical protein
MKLGYQSFFLITVIIFALGCFYYYPFISDDSLISLRYAKRFIEGKGLTWNDGHPVEGYSNLLWVLGVSALGKMGMDLIVAARILGIICSIGTLAAILSYFRTQSIKKEYIFLAVLLLVTTPCFVVWAIGGLEQPLYIFLLTLVLIEVSRIVNDKNFSKIYLLSLWLGLLAITRPDGFLFTILTSGFLLFINRNNKRNLIKIFFAAAILPTLFLLGQLIFRYNFYGEWVPNTALVKVKVTIHHILRGGFYNVKAFLATLLLSTLGLFTLYHLVFQKKNLFGFFLLLNIIAWVSYVTLVGGDIFPAIRHYYVVLILFVFAIIFGLDKLQFTIKNKNTKLGLIFLLIINGYAQTLIPLNHYAIDERWEFRGMKLGETLKNTFPDKTLIAVTAAGCIPYSSDLPTVDMLGLNDYYIPRHPPENFGTGALAHELGDAKYVLNRNPDIIIYHMGVIPEFNVGEQMKINPVFKNNYVQVLAEQNNDQHILYFNKYGKNTGIKKRHDMLQIPGYLFNNTSGEKSFFIENKLVKLMDKGKPYNLSFINPSNEKWEVKNSGTNSSDFDVKIMYENNVVKVVLIPEKRIFLEKLELQRKY